MASKTASRSGQSKSSSPNGGSKSKAKSAASTRSRAKATQSNGGSAKPTTAKASRSNGSSAKPTTAKASRSNGSSAKRTTAKATRAKSAKRSTAKASRSSTARSTQSHDNGLVETVKDTASKASGPVKDAARKAKGPAVAVGAAAGVAGGVLLANRMKRKTVLGVKVPRSVSKELSNLDVKSVAKSIGKASEQLAKTSKTVSSDIERAGDQAERIGKILG